MKTNQARQRERARGATLAREVLENPKQFENGDWRVFVFCVF